MFNSLFGKMLQRIARVVVLDDIIIKYTVEEAREILLSYNSNFIKSCIGNGISIKTAKRELERSFNKCDKYFSLHKIKNSQIRKLVDISMKLNDNAFSYNNYINGKDILLIDDIMAFGESMDEASTLILNDFTPKSVSILTFLSQRQSKSWSGQIINRR